MDDIVEHTIYFAVVGAATVVTLLILIAIGSDGNVDYCWIEAHSKDTPSIHFYLKGHRPWRDDPQMGVFGTFDEAVSAADKASCPLHK